jgi:hypothetical protein
MLRTSIGVCGLLLGSCAIPNAIEQFDDRCPPPEFGRPAWVRVCAGAGAWAGGIAGGVVSIVLLPITYPLSLLAEDGFSEHASSEFLLFPAIGGAAVGHCLLGVPMDSIDWVFRRAWTESHGATDSYEMVPMPGPAVPPAEQPQTVDGER